MSKLKVIVTSFLFFLFQFSLTLASELFTVGTGSKDSISYEFVKDAHKILRYYQPRNEDELDVYPTSSFEERVELQKTRITELTILPIDYISEEDDFWMTNKVLLGLWSTKLFAFKPVLVRSSDIEPPKDGSQETEIVYGLSQDRFIASPLLSKWKKDVLINQNVEQFEERVKAGEKALFLRAYTGGFYDIKSYYAGKNIKIEAAKLPYFMKNQLDSLQPPFSTYEYRLGGEKHKTLKLSYVLIAHKDIKSEVVKELLVHIFWRRYRFFGKPKSFELIESKATKSLPFEVLHPVTKEFFNLQ